MLVTCVFFFSKNTFERLDGQNFSNMGMYRQKIIMNRLHTDQNERHCPTGNQEIPEKGNQCKSNGKLTFRGRRINARKVLTNHKPLYIRSNISIRRSR